VEKRELCNLNVKIPKTLKELIAKYVACDLHTNASDFTRDALREKLARDAPALYKGLFQEGQKE
jgi:Arc/MetJ-type ribon-helix-helix transcriptional regulator